MGFIMELAKSFIQALVERCHSRPANRVKRLEQHACRLHREITGCKLEKTERFTSCQLIDIFCRKPPAAVKQSLRQTRAQEPYCSILYWLWYYGALA